ncbi:hypothetical protein [Alsobacter sp. R-9]
MRVTGFVALMAAALALSTSVAAAQTNAGSTTKRKPAKPATQKVQPFPQAPQQDQSYLYLPGNSRPSGPPDYVLQGMRQSNQPFYNTGGTSGGIAGDIPIWSNR